MTRAEAIKEKCLDCCCGQRNEVYKCTAEKCPLWRYRTGKDEQSDRKSNMTDEQRKAAGERLKKARESKNG